jgi:hypothetical protein
MMTKPSPRAAAALPPRITPEGPRASLNDQNDQSLREKLCDVANCLGDVEKETKLIQQSLFFPMSATGEPPVVGEGLQGILVDVAQRLALVCAELIVIRVRIG